MRRCKKNLEALHLASALMTGADGADTTRDEVQNALRAFVSMISRTEKAQTKFSPGTSQHTLLQHRLVALRLAKARLEAALTGANT